MQAWEELELRRAIWLPVMSLCSGIAAAHDKNKAMATSTSTMRIFTGNGADTLHAMVSKPFASRVSVGSKHTVWKMTKDAS
jgi:hypothetical protein